MPTTKKNNLLEYKGHPLMRKENIIYYGSMSVSHHYDADPRIW